MGGKIGKANLRRPSNACGRAARQCVCQQLLCPPFPPKSMLSGRFFFSTRPSGGTRAAAQGTTLISGGRGESTTPIIDRRDSGIQFPDYSSRLWTPFTTLQLKTFLESTVSINPSVGGKTAAVTTTGNLRKATARRRHPQASAARVPPDERVKKKSTAQH